MTAASRRSVGQTQGVRIANAIAQRRKISASSGTASWIARAIT
jgi:hypothetical protein